jgi:hypothetical protein
MKTRYAFLGKLPSGKWEFCLIDIYGEQPVVIVVDRTGNNTPRMIIDNKLVEL